MSDVRYKCVNGHDLCNQMYPGPECPYCEQERDLREIEAERAREERRRVLEEAARLCYLVPWEGPWKSAAQELGDLIRALIDKEPGRG